MCGSDQPRLYGAAINAKGTGSQQAIKVLALAVGGTLLLSN
jgi:hypothetical protein